MTTRYDKSALSTRRYDWALGLKLAVTSAHSDTTALDAVEVWLHPTVNMFITLAQTAELATAANAAGSMPLVAGVPFHMQIPQGWFISAIRADTTDGFLFIMPVA